VLTGVSSAKLTGHRKSRAGRHVADTVVQAIA